MYLSIEDVAAICHAAHRAYCQALGDHSIPEWKDAPGWQRGTLINGVLLHIRTPGLPPSASHESWLKEKVADGWTYGPAKDPDAKTHPCCVPYDELPPEQKAKDTLFTGIIDALRDLTKRP